MLVALKFKKQPIKTVDGPFLHGCKAELTFACIRIKQNSSTKWLFNQNKAHLHDFTSVPHQQNNTLKHQQTKAEHKCLADGINQETLYLSTRLCLQNQQTSRCATVPKIASIVTGFNVQAGFKKLFLLTAIETVYAKTNNKHFTLALLW